MNISPTSSIYTALQSSAPAADVHQAVTIKMLKQSIDLQGQLALSLLPQTPSVDPTSSLGLHIDTHA